MNISIFTMILPRLEVFFLEEWIQHNLKIGISKIHLYNHGSKPCPSRGGKQKNRTQLRYLSQDERGKKWPKKPDAEYFLEYSDLELYEKLTEIVNRYKNNVTLTSWNFGTDHQFGGYMPAQLNGYRHAIENNHSDWWTTLDPDEYLYSEKYETIGDFLNETNKNAIRLSQRVFDQRQKNKSVRELYNYGFDAGMPTKTFVKSPVDVSRIGIHKNVSMLGGGIHRTHPTNFRYNHYRGPSTLSGGPAYWKFDGVKFDKIDKGMLKYL
jgi:hypothetical protein